MCGYRVTTGKIECSHSVCGVRRAVAPRGKTLGIGLRYVHPSIRVHCALSSDRPSTGSLHCAGSLAVQNMRALGYTAFIKSGGVKGALVLPIV